MENEKIYLMIDELTKSSYCHGFLEAYSILGDIITNTLGKSNNLNECMTLRWVLDNMSNILYEKGLIGKQS